MRSTSLALFAVLALAAALPAAAQQVSGLQAMTLTYQVLVQGSSLGTVTTALALEGEEWTAASSTQGPMSQESQVRFRPDFTPVSSHLAASQGPLSIQSDLRFEQGRITGSARLPAQMGGDKQIDAQVPPGTLLPEMEVWYLATALLEPGKAVTIPRFDAMSGVPVSATYTVSGTESVTVPAGTFDAYRLVVSGLPTPLALLVRKDGLHIVLKQELSGQPVSVVLQTMK